MEAFYLRNYDIFFEYYNIITKEILQIDKDINSIGFYSKNDNDILKICVINRKINISLNDLNIIVTDDTPCQIDGTRLTISDSISINDIHCWSNKPTKDNLFYEPTSEDNNLCILIFNILNNQDRMRIFIENNSFN